MEIRNVEISDAAALLGIYAPYVEKTAISFEYEVPSLEVFTERIRNISAAFPYIVAEENGRILGYCYVGTFHERQAYDKSVETSIYVSEQARGRGIGRKLYEYMEKELKARGIKNLYACISYTADEEHDENLTNDSMRFHEKMGYKLCGHFHECGLKFGKWYDMIYMEKII